MIFDKSLGLRVFSALALMPVVLFLLIYGGGPFLFMMGAALWLAIGEWMRMTKGHDATCTYVGTGAVYILFCMTAFIGLRLHHPDGAAYALALLLCVWASDSGAYFTGKAIGGPKMAPSISPNKTWAGFFGGTASSALALIVYDLCAGPLFSDLTGTDLAIDTSVPLWVVAILGASITLSGQAGDLIVSFVKRKVGVKDTGTLIPGHGGLLDRIDSLLLASPIFLISLKVLGL